MKSVHSQAAEIPASGISAFESANGLSLPTCVQSSMTTLAPSHSLLLYSGPCSKRQWLFQTGFLRGIGRSTSEGRWVMGSEVVSAPIHSLRWEGGFLWHHAMLPPGGCLGKFPLKWWGWGRGWAGNMRAVSGSLVKNPRPSGRRGFNSWVGKIPWSLEKKMATHSSILAWRVPWTEDPGGLQSVGSQKSRTRIGNEIYTHLWFLFAVWWGLLLDLDPYSVSSRLKLREVTWVLDGESVS